MLTSKMFKSACLSKIIHTTNHKSLGQVKYHLVHKNIVLVTIYHYHYGENMLIHISNLH